jgi:hypothetical protein
MKNDDCSNNNEKDCISRMSEGLYAARNANLYTFSNMLNLTTT